METRILRLRGLRVYLRAIATLTLILGHGLGIETTRVGPMISQGAFYHLEWWQKSFVHSFMFCSESYVYQTHIWTVGYGECDSWSPGGGGDSWGESISFDDDRFV